MPRKRRRIRFVLPRRKQEFVVGTLHRFIWSDVYYALQVISQEVEEPMLALKLENLLNSDRQAVHAYLFEILEALEYDNCTSKDRVRAAGWIIACYGYFKQLPVMSKTHSWPHPAPLRRTRKTKFQDWRELLSCPICKHKFIPPKRFKNHKPIMKWFAVEISKHISSEHGG